MILLIFGVIGVIVVGGLQIWKHLARTNERLASRLQIAIIVLGVLFAVVKLVGDYTANDKHQPSATAGSGPSSSTIGATTTPLPPPTLSPIAERSEAASTTSPRADAAPLPSATPEPTPCESPVAVMPDEIVARFWDTSLESYDKDSYLSALIGLCVQWTLHFWSAERLNDAPDEMLVSLIGNENRATHVPVYVYFRVPYKTHERFPLLDHGRRIRVKGEIDRIDGQGAIQLKNAMVEIVE